MFFRQYYLGCLSHASYLVGDSVTGKAVVVDPQRDVAQYLADAEAHGLTITHVLETHFHADFLSGHLELAERTGAVIGFGRAAEDKVQFPIQPYDDGDLIRLGEVVLQIRETPGHTPESISIVVYPHGEHGEPEGVLTGDTLFIGDVGRPDLLSAIGYTADELAVQLYHSLHDKLLTLPDHAKVWPAHGAGSACGKNLSTETVSTIGEQRRTNYALAPMTVDQFREAVTQGQSVAPLYFLFAATQNRQQRDLYEDAPVTMLTLEEVLAHQADGAVVVDAREDMVFAAGHLRGSVNVGLGGRFAEYAGEVMQPGTPIVLVCEPGTENEARTRLARIGFDRVLGALHDPVAAFVQHPEHVTQLSRLSVASLEERMRNIEGLVLVDIRNPGEVADTGTIPGAREIGLPALITRMGELDPAAPTVVFCAGGYRSAIASSLLRSHGFTDVSDLIGGYTAWSTAATPA
ncbi:MAG TPA: MBL fold metallo-hydrolase [Acidimicrobiaceae bacterium]|nr:MBL fold metallo-hydrolase [Acidimicrobiaceae bacterium]